jgi:hypothetical protein
MTTFFFYRSVEKAFQIDEHPSGLSLNLNKPIDASPPFTILAIDDIFFVVNVMIQKSLATSQKEIVAHVIAIIGRVLGSDFVGMIRHKMRDETYPKPLVQGGLPSEDKIILFIILINSLDMAKEYLARIVSTNLGVGVGVENSLTKSTPIRDAFPVTKDASFIADSLSDLLRLFTIKTTELLNEGLQTLFNNAVKVKLRRVVSDTFRDADYSLTKEKLANLAVDDDGDKDTSDQVTRTFEHGWDQLMRPIARIMTAKMFAVLLDTTARYLTNLLEKRIWSYARRMSAFGAVRMERDFSNIANAAAGGDYSVREVFARVSQMLMVVNMDHEEWHEANNESGGDHGISWVLTEEEKARARALVRG